MAQWASAPSVSSLCKTHLLGCGDGKKWNMTLGEVGTGDGGWREGGRTMDSVRQLWSSVVNMEREKTRRGKVEGKIYWSREGGRQYRRGEEHWEGGRSPWSSASDLVSWSSTSAEGGKSQLGFTLGTFSSRDLSPLGFNLVEYSLRDSQPAACWSPSCWTGDFQVWYEKKNIFVCFFWCAFSVSLL